MTHEAARRPPSACSFTQSMVASRHPPRTRSTIITLVCVSVMHRLTRCRAHAHPVSMAITRRRTITDRFIIIIINVSSVRTNLLTSCAGWKQISDCLPPGNSNGGVRSLSSADSRSNDRGGVTVTTATMTGQQLCYMTVRGRRPWRGSDDFLFYIITLKY